MVVSCRRIQWEVSNVSNVYKEEEHLEHVCWSLGRAMVQENKFVPVIAVCGHRAIAPCNPDTPLELLESVFICPVGS
jgi:hypothetical protein